MVDSEFQKTYNLNNELQTFMSKIENSLDENGKSNKMQIKHFQCEMLKKKNLFGKLLVTLEQIRKELIDSHGVNFIKQVDVIIFEINNSKKLNCYQSIALFLIYVFRFASKKFYRDCVFIFVSFIHHLNINGHKYIADNNLLLGDTHSKDGVKTSQSQKSESQLSGRPHLDESGPVKRSDEEADFCENQTAEIIPHFANSFMANHFRQCISSDVIVNDHKELSYIRMEPLSLLWVIVILKFFCQWLYIHRFTKSNVEIHKS